MKKNYDSFAPCYDLAMGDQKETARDLQRLFRRFAPGARSLLEFGCGSGSLLKIFSKNYQCQGIELSPEMARLARRKVPRVPVTVGDIAEVSIGRRFDLVVCAFDTINHIPDFSRWKKVFQRACEQLSPQGVFIFDINTIAKIDRYHEEPPYVEVAPEGVSVFDVTRTGGAFYDLSVKVFRPLRGDQYRLHEMIVHGAAYPVSRITRELKRHFRQVRLVDPERTRVTSGSEEIYFVCSGLRR